MALLDVPLSEGSKPVDTSGVDKLSGRMDTSIAKREEKKQAAASLLEEMRQINMEYEQQGKPHKYPPVYFDKVRQKFGIDSPHQDPKLQAQQSAGRAEAGQEPEMTTGNKVAAGYLGTVSGLPVVGPLANRAAAELTPGDRGLNLEGLRGATQSDYGQLGSGVIAPALGAVAAPLALSGALTSAPQALSLPELMAGAGKGAAGAEGLLASDAAIRSADDGGGLNQFMGTMTDPKTQAITLGTGMLGGAGGASLAKNPRSWATPKPPPPMEIETLAGSQEVNPGLTVKQRMGAVLPAAKGALLANAHHPFLAIPELMKAGKMAFNSGERGLSLEQGPPVDLGRSPQLKGNSREVSPALPVDDIFSSPTEAPPIDTSYLPKGNMEVQPALSFEELMAEQPKTIDDVFGPERVRAEKVNAQADLLYPKPKEYFERIDQVNDASSKALKRFKLRDDIESNPEKPILGKQPEPYSQEDVLTHYGPPEAISSRIEDFVSKERSRIPSEEDTNVQRIKGIRPMSLDQLRVEQSSKPANSNVELSAMQEEVAPKRSMPWTQIGEAMKVAEKPVRIDLHKGLSKQGNTILEEKFGGDVGQMIEWVKSSGIAKDTKQLASLFGPGFTEAMAQELGLPKAVRPSKAKPKAEEPKSEVKTNPGRKKKPYSPYLDSED